MHICVFSLILFLKHYFQRPKVGHPNPGSSLQSNSANFRVLEQGICSRQSRHTCADRKSAKLYAQGNFKLRRRDTLFKKYFRQAGSSPRLPPTQRIIIRIGFTSLFPITSPCWKHTWTMFAYRMLTVIAFINLCTIYLEILNHPRSSVINTEEPESHCVSHKQT